MDKSVIDFNVRLRTIRIRDLIIGIIITVIISTIVTGIFPVIDSDDNLFMILFLLIAVLLFAYALRGTRGLENNFEDFSNESLKKEILYVFIINLLFACLFMFLISAFDFLSGVNDPNWIQCGTLTLLILIQASSYLKQLHP